MKIKIHVTEEVLRKTAHCNSSEAQTNCAFAYAVRDIFPNAAVSRLAIETNPIFISSGAWISENDTEIILPLEATEFIDRFDKSTPFGRTIMEPISVEVTIPASVIDKIGISDIYKILSESKTLELVAP